MGELGFAGNAALLGTCDAVIATASANIGMAGPAMIEGGGLGKVAPTAIGPTSEQSANGVVDLVAADDLEAVALAKRYLSYFQGALPPPADGAAFACADQRALRHAVPESRKRSYEVRDVVRTLSDDDSWLELRRGFGEGIVSGLADNLYERLCYCLLPSDPESDGYVKLGDETPLA